MGVSLQLVFGQTQLNPVNLVINVVPFNSTVLTDTNGTIFLSLEEEPPKGDLRFASEKE